MATIHFPCLSETFILNQICDLIDKGHDVSIFALGAEQGKSIHNDVTEYQLLEKTTYLEPHQNKATRWIKAIPDILWALTYCPRSLLRSLNPFIYGKQVLTLRPLYSFLALAKASPPDIIVCHFGTLGREIIEFSEILPKVPIVTRFYGYDVTRYDNAISQRYAALARKGTLFLALCESMKANLVQLGFPNGKILCHGLGIRTQRFSYRDRRNDNSPFVRLVTVARFCEKKGLIYLLESLSLLHQRSVAPFKCTFVGDGTLRKTLETKVKELFLDDIVTFVGSQPQDKIIQFLDAADIFVAPSVVASDGDQEGTPTVLMEAQAMGIPVVSTFHSGIPEIVIDGQTGLLVEEKNTQQLASALETLIGNATIRFEMGKNGRIMAEEKFEISNLNTQLIELFSKLLNQKSEQ